MSNFTAFVWRLSVSNFALLRVLVVLILILAPAAAYAAKGPCVGQTHNPAIVGGVTCVNGSYNSTKVVHKQVFSCAGIDEEGCNPSETTRVSAENYLYTTAQSPAQLQAQNDEANAISNAYIACVATGVAAATAGGVGALWSFLFGGPAGVVVAGVLLVAGGIVTVTCVVVNVQQMAAHQARLNSCAFVSYDTTRLADTMSSSCN
ncbi:hypothetical protein FACS189419_08690 [Planctomycetales bacterium]|nr:hypothetical protein FACS189419_08690 [Planctomycetales bacterium]